MMRGVNAFGAALSLIALARSGELLHTSRFVRAHPLCMLHLAALATTGTLGQLFIYYTISNFGAVTFSMLMASRQLFSLALSSLLFGHELSRSSTPFAALVFLTMVFKIRKQVLPR
jgi:adenosine 3'-phospho 5'-phosphosulfate transporter B2